LVNTAAIKHLVQGALFCLLLFRPSFSSAENPLMNAIQSFHEGYFEKSMRLLTELMEEVDDPPKLAQVHLYIGLNHVVFDHIEKARDAFRNALKNDPLITLKRGAINETMVSVFNAVKSQMSGVLSITSDRRDTKVMLDGTVVGQTPFKGPVTIGKHQISLSADDGLYEGDVAVVVYHNKIHEIHQKLSFAGGTLRIITTPGAIVKIDDKVVGTAPIKRLALHAKKYRVSISLQWHNEHIQDIEIEKNREKVLNVSLVKIPRPIKVVRQPSWRWPVWTIASGGAALGVLGLGIGMGASAQSAYNEYETTKDLQRYNELRDTITTRKLVANISFAVAGALAITSAAIYYFWERHKALRPPSKETAALHPITRQKYHRPGGSSLFEF
jgi:hypothetical protein